MNGKEDIYKLLLKIASKNTGDEADDDAQFQKATKQQIRERDTNYTELLKHFLFVTKARNLLKELFKWIFLLIVIICMIILSIITTRLFFEILSKAESIKQIKDAIPVLVTAITGFVSVVIIIPTIITKYLFSTKEDENITQIILHTQDHDNSGREWAKNIVDSKDEHSVNQKTKIENISKN